MLVEKTHATFQVGRTTENIMGDTDVIRVIFCGVAFPTAFEYTEQFLLPYNFIQVDAVPFDEVSDKIGNYDICVVRGMRLESKVIARAKQMKLIMQFGVGLEGVDIEAATKFGIKVARIPGSGSGNSLSCAELAIYLILGLLRNQKAMDIAFKERKLGDPTGETLYGKTVFILGYGNIGKDLAVRLKPFGVKILATRRRWNSNSAVSLNNLDAGDTSQIQTMNNGCMNDDLLDEKGGTERLLEFASEADIVVACCQLNAETVGLVNAKFLSAMKKGALLVNIARGGLMDYEAVKASLESGHLGGLGLDVAWYEPFDPEDPISQHPKVLITPHVAGVTELSYRNMAKIVGECALSLHNGEPFSGIEIVN